MKTFDNIYDFYDLDDEEAAKFVSTFISEKGPVYKKKKESAFKCGLKVKVLLSCL